MCMVVKGKSRLDIMVNKQVWMDCFGAGVPTEDELVRDIRRLQTRLATANCTHQGSGHCSRLYNSLHRREKMLAAVMDGQPWAWMLYPSSADLEDYAA